MPRRQILTSEEKECLRIVPDDDILLTRMCFLSEQDLALINKHRGSANRLGFAVLLCYLRGPGFTPDKNSSPHDGVISRLTDWLKLQPDLWHEYAVREETRWEHLAELYRYLRLSPFSRSLQKTCIRHLYPHAMRTDKGWLIAEEMLSWLHNNKGLSGRARELPPCAPTEPDVTSLYIDLCNCPILICLINPQKKVNLWTTNSYRLLQLNWLRISKPLMISVSFPVCSKN